MTARAAALVPKTVLSRRLQWKTARPCTQRLAADAGDALVSAPIRRYGSPLPILTTRKMSFVESATASISSKLFERRCKRPWLHDHRDVISAVHHPRAQTPSHKHNDQNYLDYKTGLPAVQARINDVLSEINYKEAA